MFPQLAAAIFLIVVAAHALRLIFKWVVLGIGGWQVPMWVSAVAIVITAYLAYELNSFHEKAGRGQGTLRFFLSVSLFPFS